MPQCLFYSLELIVIELYMLLPDAVCIGMEVSTAVVKGGCYA